MINEYKELSNSEKLEFHRRLRGGRSMTAEKLRKQRSLIFERNPHLKPGATVIVSLTQLELIELYADIKSLLIVEDGGERLEMETCNLHLANHRIVGRVEDLFIAVHESEFVDASSSV